MKDVLAGLLVFAALALLVAEQVRDKADGQGSGGYYSQF